MNWPPAQYRYAASEHGGITGIVDHAGMESVGPGFKPQPPHYYAGF